MDSPAIRRRTLLSLSAAVFGAEALSSCNRAPAGSSSGEAAVTIAYSIDVLDDTQNVVLQAMKAQVAKRSKEGKAVELTVYDAQSSVDKQLSDVQTALLKKPSVLILSAVDPQGSLPAAQQAASQGVPVIDKRPSDPEPKDYKVAFYSNDESRYPAATEEWLKGILRDDPSLVLRVGLCYGAPAQTAQLARCDVVKKLADAMPERIQVVAEGYGNWLTDTAQSLATDWLQAHPDLNYVCAANDIMALGIANAVASAGRTADVRVSGYDLTDDGLERIRKGSQTFDVGVSLTDSGAQLIDVALGVVAGSFTKTSYSVSPVYSVTKDNVDTFQQGGSSTSTATSSSAT